MKGFQKELLLATIKATHSEKDIEVRERERRIDEEQNEEEEDQDRGLAVACKATRRLVRKALGVCQPHIVG